MRNSFAGIYLLSVLFAVHSSTLWAQVGQAQLVGTVRDSTGAVIPGAQVVALNERTGARRATTTNEQGYFVVPQRSLNLARS